MRTTIIATIIALTALVAPAIASASPQHAAQTTASCLKAHGWKVSVKGRQVKATGVRTRPANAYPRHPRYEAIFSDGAPIEMRWALNDRETRQVNRCV